MADALLFFLNILMPITSNFALQKEWGWEIFQSIEKYCKAKFGYASLYHVDNPNSQDDRMESFFMAETLKYLYLLFDPDSEIDILNKVFFLWAAY